MRRFLTLFLALNFSGLALAETAPNAAPQAQGPQAPGPKQSGSAVQIWDDRVFDLGEKAAPPDKRKSANGTERYLGAEADYNSGQRTEWLAACEYLKNDLRAYRECFSQQKQKSNERIQQNRAEVEGRSSLPMRNVPLPQYDSESQRNPAFDAQVERTEE
jgi:hypothetical protein